MAVYVDPPRAYYTRHRLWCHLWGPDEDELIDFAVSIGCKREWFQDHPTMPHFDLTPNLRARAVAAGAVEVESAIELAKLAKAARAKAGGDRA